MLINFFSYNIKSIPNDIILKPMSREHAVKVNELWPNRHPKSLFFIQRCIDWNPNIGAFTKDGDELVAWCLRHQCGALGTLQTAESHQRRGLGALVTKAMMKILADLEMDTFGLVGSHNISSVKLFERLGFEVIDECCWLRTFPVDREFSWSD